MVTQKQNWVLPQERCIVTVKFGGRPTASQVIFLKCHELKALKPSFKAGEGCRRGEGPSTFLKQCGQRKLIGTFEV